MCAGDPRCDPGRVVRRCLIVDDNQRFLDVARSSLEREGIEVLATATTIAEAMQKVAEHHPDFVLVDIALGAESGFELTRRLVAKFPELRSRIVLISTRVEEDFDGPRRRPARRPGSSRSRCCRRPGSASSCPRAAVVSIARGVRGARSPGAVRCGTGPSRRTAIRRLSGLLAGAALVAAVSAVVELLDEHVPVPSLLSLYLLAVLPVAIVWGPGFALLVAVVSAVVVRRPVPVAGASPDRRSRRPCSRWWSSSSPRPSSVSSRRGRGSGRGSPRGSRTSRPRCGASPRWSPGRPRRRRSSTRSSGRSPCSAAPTWRVWSATRRTGP